MTRSPRALAGAATVARRRRRRWWSPARWWRKAEGHVVAGRRPGGRPPARDRRRDRRVSRPRAAPPRIVETPHGSVWRPPAWTPPTSAGGALAAAARGRRCPQPGSLRSPLRGCSGVNVGVLVSDTFGRPWRDGVSRRGDRRRRGLSVLGDHRGRSDAHGHTGSRPPRSPSPTSSPRPRLVKGKLSGSPGGCRPRPSASPPPTPTKPGARPLVRRGPGDLFSPAPGTSSPAARPPTAHRRDGALRGHRGLPGRGGRAAGVPRRLPLRARGGRRRRRRGRRPPRRGGHPCGRRWRSVRSSAPRWCSSRRGLGDPLAAGGHARRQWAGRPAADGRTPT